MLAAAGLCSVAKARLKVGGGDGMKPPSFYCRRDVERVDTVPSPLPTRVTAPDLVRLLTECLTAYDALGGCGPQTSLCR